MDKAQRRLKINQIALLVMAIILVFVVWRSEQRIFDRAGDLVVREVAPDTLRFSWSGDVKYPMSRQFEEAFETWRDEADRIIIDLHSPGGSLAEGREVIRVISRMKRTHLIETRVGSYRSCLSMCVPIYLQGEVRTAAPSSRWMFHEPTAKDAITGETVGIPENEQRYTSNKFVRDFFVSSDMDPEWLEGLLGEWEGEDVWRSGRDLVEEQSGIIQRLE